MNGAVYILKNLHYDKFLFKDIFPFLRFIDLVPLNPNIPAINKISYDHRFLYICSGKGKININNVSYFCEKGDLFFWKPLAKYSVERDSYNPAVIINICFDFTQNNNNIDIPRYMPYTHYNHDISLEAIKFIDNKLFNSPFKIPKYFEAECKLLEMLKEHKTKKLYYVEQSNAQLLAFIMSLARYHSIDKSKIKEKHNTTYEIIAYIHEHFNEPLTNIQLGKIFNFHPNHINKLIVNSTGTSLHKYVLNTKINKAAELMITKKMTITQVSLLLGFTDVSHFTKTFKKIMGYNPSEIYFHSL